MNSQLNNGPDFKSSDEAFEYLLNERLDEKRKKEWAKELGPGPDDIDEESEGPKKSKTLFIRLVSVAASILLIGGAFYFLQMTEPLDQYAANLMQETEISMSYGSDSRGERSNEVDRNIATLKSELTTVLLNEDYNQALGYFRQLEKLSSLSNEDKHYFAIALLKSKGEDYQKAIRLLNDVIKNDDHNLKKALWYRALAFGMTANKPLMKKDLNQLNSISDKKDKKVLDLLSKY